MEGTKYQIIDKSGFIEKGHLNKILKSPLCENCLNITFVGSNKSGTGTLIKSLFDIEESEFIENNPSAQILGDSSLKRSNGFNETLVFDLFDPFDHEKYQKEKSCFNTGLAIGEIIVLNFPWFHFEFKNSIGFQKIQKVTNLLRDMVRNQIISNDLPKTFVIALRDFDFDKEELESKRNWFEKTINDEIKLGLEKVLKNFGVVFYFFPHAKRSVEKFSEVVGTLKNFLSTQENSLFFSSQNYNKEEKSLEEILKKISNFSSNPSDSKLFLDSKEMVGYQICEEIFYKTFSQFKNSMEPLKICCEEGGIIQNFGKEADKLIEDSLEQFQTEAYIFQTTKVFSEKKKILKENLLSCLQEIFQKQILKLKELSFQSFKELLSSIQVTGDVENQVSGSIRVTEKYFNSKIDSLKPLQAKKSWSSEKERKELVSGIREMATERLQAARLQGVYLKKNKNPVALSFYYLHPHPFGKDLRLDHMTLSDSLGFNPELSKRAGLMRQFVATRGDSKKINSPEGTDNHYEDLIYQEEPMKSFQNNSR